MKTTDRKNELINWVERIGQKLYVIKISRKMYDEFIKNCNQNKFKGLKPEFLWWIKNNYEYSIILLLTGLLENSKRHDDLNFQKFLKSVKEYGIENIKAELFADKPQYFSDFNNIVFETPKDDDIVEIRRREYFEEKYFSNIDIKQDIERINDNFSKLRAFRNKFIAHFTNCTKQFNITNSDLDNIIKEIIEIFDKYASIIQNASYTSN